MTQEAAVVNPDDMGISEMDAALDEADKEGTPEADDESATPGDTGGDESPEPEESTEDDADAEGNEPDADDADDDTPPEEPEKEVEHDSAEKKRQRDAYLKAQNEIKERDRKIAELQAELKKKELGGFKELSAEELEDLKWEDPDKYADYLIKKREFDAQQAELQKQQQAQELQEVQEATWNNLTEVIQEVKGIDPTDQKALAEFLQSDEMKAVDALLTEDFRPNGKGIYTAKAIRKAFKLASYDNAVAKARLEGAEKGADAIKNAANAGSRMNNVTGDPSGKRSGVKKLEDYTQPELDAMGDTQLRQVLQANGIDPDEYYS